jgi:hypothetical protein
MRADAAAPNHETRERTLALCAENARPRDACTPRWDDVGELIDHLLTTIHPTTRAAVKHVRSLAGAHTRLVDFEARLLAQMEEDEVVFERVRQLADARSSRGPFPPPPWGVGAQEQRMRERHAQLHQQAQEMCAIARARGVPQDRVDALVQALATHFHLVSEELLPRACALEPASG